MKTIFNEGWAVLQDYYDLGERYRLFDDAFDHETAQCAAGHGANFQLDEWTPIPMLGHLQTLLSDDPHYGPEMRLYNAAPWWYRRTFDLTAQEASTNACLRFEGVDYYCKVWLNGHFLGAHEGYTTPFEFEIGGLMREHNVLYVKVWSPLEFERSSEDDSDPRFFYAVRHMMKGTYEHGDSLLHRDRNPVGIWREVSLTLYDEVRAVGDPRIDARLQADGTAAVSVELTVHSAVPCHKEVRMLAFSRQSDWTCRAKKALDLSAGDTTCRFEFTVERPELWNTWDRGAANLYAVTLCLDGVSETTARFGIRKVELRRTQDETSFYFNDRRIYVRGISYYPEAYLSTMTQGRYERDLAALKRMGCNMVRVHVHEEQPAFYDLCDEMGIAVMQDTDFNWVHPCDKAWTDSALRIVEDQEKTLHNHPAVVSWVCLNEPISPHQPEMGRNDPANRFVFEQPGPQLYDLLSRKSNGCGIIRGSYCSEDLLSGDSHNYIGSLDGPEDNYEAVERTKEKFNTEFGFDAPPVSQRLWRERKIFRRMNVSPEKIAELQRYQYQYIKYFIEYYRMCKYAPTSGHMPFMLIDCSPSTFYGTLDYDGCAKPSIEAFFQSNQPIGLFMKREGASQGLYAVNDYAETFEDCTLFWRATDAHGEMLAQDKLAVNLPPDSIGRVADLALDGQAVVTLEIWLKDAAGNVIARNRYDDPFHPMAHPKGHPWHFSYKMGVRLY